MSTHLFPSDSLAVQLSYIQSISLINDSSVLAEDYLATFRTGSFCSDMMLKPFYRSSNFTVILFATVIFTHSTLASTNFTQCLQDIRQGKFGPNASVDNSGLPVSNVSSTNCYS
ncbi:hypothetical protein J3R30DRAFT_3422359 [Lentinula aciculospora]|uniref:Uncharacterized protein n=1 Tax=Lentinula aciculospora TaxID=153920 RepID=A0A9W9DXZ5_9AGAR|nr:hypothetical protein J3R30DRAFT_3422359 [Lentinula aciculospora]